MSGRTIEINGRKVWVLENGGGAPLLYLHGFADVHGVKESWLPFHERLAERAHVIAPAHPGCAQSDENKDIDAIDDVVFHYLEVLDALKLTQFILVGSCVGGWIAAEIAARHPKKIRKLVLIGAAGLFVEGALIGDIFMMAQPERGSSYASLREMLFSSANQPNALELFPDGMGNLDDELRRYQMLRFCSRIGFRPPYFYNRPLRNRLHRIISPALVIWGEKDNFVPRSHGETYAKLLPNCSELKIIPASGHSVIVEKPDETAKLVVDFLNQRGQV
ncbi:MAG: alpha/beta hydrolase [Deltaproteobacteria bacterium]|nr:alpha/beta hydrolase [Deltaproteobacteria bacterium]MBI3064681.1 alpha/beta hydrolase [Deltaproteobacteria bacterium]